MIKNVENSDSFYHGNVHFNFWTGVPFLKNKVLVEVPLFSNGLITSKRDNIKPTYAKGNKTSQSYQQQNYQSRARVHGTSSHNQQYSNHFNLNGCYYQQRSKPYNHVIDKKTLKTDLVTADIARTDTLRPIFCVSSRPRLSAERKAKAFFLNLIEY